MSTQSSDRAISVETSSQRVQVTYNGHVLADSRRALILKEGNLQPVVYFPREDADMVHLTPTSHSSHCPHKGDASYFTAKIGNGIAENAAWSYEAPLPGAEQIRGHIAFYPDRVDRIGVVEDDTAA